MKNIKFIAALALMPIMLAACGGENPTPSSSGGETQSSDPGVYSTEIHDDVHVSVGVHFYGNALKTVEEGVSYTNASTFQKNYVVNITKNDATENLVANSDHILMPAGSKFVITLANSSYYFFDSAQDTSGSSYNTALTFIEAVDPANLGLEGASGTASELNVNLSFTGTVTTFSFVPTAAVKLSKITLCYGVRSL